MSLGESMKTEKRRIVIAEDHPLMREGLVQFINRQGNWVCCGEADSAATTRSAVAQHNPDLLLLDLRLGTDDGLELIKSLNAEFPQLPILVVSQSDESIYAERALRAGARGYIMKREAADEVQRAIAAVLNGDRYVSRRVGLLAFEKSLGAKSLSPGSGVESLSDRELQVFELLGCGLSSREIAAKVNLSGKTIETYRGHIKHKLGLRGAEELIRAATKWVEEEQPARDRPA